MNFDYFWMGLDEIEALPNDISFGIFSTEHLIWLAITFVLGVIYVMAYKRGNETRRANLRYVLALLMIFSEFFKMSFNAMKGTAPTEYLPLELCSLAEYFILIDSMWPRGKYIKQIFAFMFLPATIMALLIPTTGKYSAVNIITFRFFLLHGGIAAYIIAEYVAKEIKPVYKGLWISLITCDILAIIMWRIDLTLDLNFFFMAGPEGNPALQFFWDISGASGGLPYIGVLTIAVAIWMHFFYGIYRLIDAIRFRKKKKAA